MLRRMKNAGWSFLAGGLGWGATAIRRRPSGVGPEAWRAVQFSYSHFGEDLVVYHLLRDLPPSARGCYVDVGAFDPVLHSNTYLLYVHGWRGLNIDASPQRLARFAAARPGDTNIVAAVSDVARDVLFLEYPTPGTSRVVTPEDSEHANALGEVPTAVTACRTEILSDLLERHSLPSEIDFINIDCEGLDLAVLHGLDWSRWSPRVIAIEANSRNAKDDIAAYLRGKGYELVSQHFVTLIFVREPESHRVPVAMWPVTIH